MKTGDTFGPTRWVEGLVALPIADLPRVAHEDVVRVDAHGRSRPRYPVEPTAHRHVGKD